jgi:hypothetical protein
MEPPDELSAAIDGPKVFEQNKLLTIDFDTYKEAEGMNSHGLMDILRSPAHFHEHKVNKVERKETTALQFGKLLHYAVLEGEMFLERYVIMPKFDRRTKAGKEGLLEWESKLKPGAIVVPEEMVDALTKISRKVQTHPKAKNLLRGGVREQSVFWTDTETGELCKGRMDFITKHGHIVDLKSILRADPRSFKKAIDNYDWHIQGAHYCSGAEIAKFADPKIYMFLAIEKDPPYEIAIYQAGVSVLGVGDQWRREAMKIYSQCRKKNIWPGYTPDITTIELPSWAEAVYPDDVEAV